MSSDKEEVKTKYKIPKLSTNPIDSVCPTNTLYIGSVGLYNKQDLENIFSKYEGFIELRLVSNYCFITFDNTEHSKIALINTYNKIKNIYITYAKTETRNLITKKNVEKTQEFKKQNWSPLPQLPLQLQLPLSDNKRKYKYKRNNKYSSYLNVVKYGHKKISNDTKAY